METNWKELLDKKFSVTEWKKLWEKINHAVFESDYESDDDSNKDYVNKPRIEIPWTEEEMRILGPLTK